jgi:hypothetical protein
MPDLGADLGADASPPDSPRPAVDLEHEVEVI